MRRHLTLALASAFASSSRDIEGWSTVQAHLADPSSYTFNAPVVNNTRGTKQHQRKMKRKRAQKRAKSRGHY